MRSRAPMSELTQAAFDSLLLVLDPDRGRAGEIYEDIRRRLLKFFEWRSLSDSASRADDTLNRLARAVQSGQPVRDMHGFALGIARLVALETIRGEKREREALRGVVGGVSDPDAEARDRCLAACLDTLPTEERRLITAYYVGDGKTKIEGRKRLAAEFGIGDNALRIRACRIRAAIETCVRARIRTGARGNTSRRRITLE
jgi:DNA-directed RNA polymerase specialized sigma24 family protein